MFSIATLKTNLQLSIVNKGILYTNTGPFILRSGCRIFCKNPPDMADAVFLEQTSLSAQTAIPSESAADNQFTRIIKEHIFEKRLYNSHSERSSIF